MKYLLLIAIAAVIAMPAYADTATCGWEEDECGGCTILGMYPEDGVIATNVGAPDPVYNGERSLKVEDNAASGTPQAFVAYIDGLLEGDIVEACFYRHDTTPGASPSCRIWGHYTSIPGDITSYHGSAGGNSDYGPGEGWDQTCHQWVFDSDEGNHVGLVVECRTYSVAGDTVWIDDLWVMAPDHATIFTPCEPVSPVESATWTTIKALYR